MGPGKGQMPFSKSFSPGKGRHQLSPGEQGPPPSHGTCCDPFLLEKESGAHRWGGGGGGGGGEVMVG